MAVLINLVVWTGFCCTSFKAIRAIDSHFDQLVQFPEDEHDDDNCACTCDKEKQKETKNIKKTENLEIELSLSINSTKTNNEKSKSSKRDKQRQTVIDLSQIPEDDVIVVYDCKTEDPAADDRDRSKIKKRKNRKQSKPLKNKENFDVEQYLFETNVSKMIAKDRNKKTEWTSSLKFSMAIKVTQIVILDKLKQYIQQSGTRIVAIDNRQLFAVMEYVFSKCELTDFEMEVMMYWIKFLKFSRIIVILLFIRMILRVCLILFQVLWWLCAVVFSNNNNNVNNVHETSQSVWDSLFVTICMSPLAICTWLIDFLIWNKIMDEYKALGILNVIQSLFYVDINSINNDPNSVDNNSGANNDHDESEPEEPLNPFVANRFKLCGCNKPLTVNKWYTWSAVFIIVITVLSFWL